MRPCRLPVMARLVRAIYSSTCAATDGPDKPGHDDVGTSRTIGQTPDFAVVSEMCASRRDTPGHDGKGTDQPASSFCTTAQRTRLPPAQAAEVPSMMSPNSSQVLPLQRISCS